MQQRGAPFRLHPTLERMPWFIGPGYERAGGVDNSEISPLPTFHRQAPRLGYPVHRLFSGPTYVVANTPTEPHPLDAVGRGSAECRRPSRRAELGAGEPLGLESYG